MDRANPIASAESVAPNTPRRMLASDEGIPVLARACTGMNVLNGADYVPAFEADQSPTRAS